MMRKWLASDEVFSKVAALRGVGPLYPTHTELAELERAEVREEIAIAVVGTALERFRRACQLGKGWKPGGGASLSTFFITGCLLGFVDEFRARRRQSQDWAARVHLDDPEVVADAVLARVIADHDAVDLDRELVAEQARVALAELDPRDAQIMLAKAARETNNYIAATLNISAKAVERRWSRLMEKYPWARELSRGRKPEKS
jgi:DNA-directed RNA polymerase specialized sigma24 family protein